MKIQLGELRKLVREALEEDLKNVGSKHQKTVGGTIVLKKMHDAPGVLDSLTDIKDPRELAQVIEALIDSVPMVKRADVLRALGIVARHERITHNR
jgi:HEAT repeat protein